VVGEEEPDKGGEGGANGECHDCTLWKDSTLEEKSESVPMFVVVFNGDFVLCFDGGLVTRERTGGAWADLLEFCNASGQAGFSVSVAADWR